jgi:predicted nucleotidyltransferase
MPAQRIQKAVEYVRKRAAKAGLVRPRVVLFGSHARGDASPGSDVDLAVISTSFEGKNALSRAAMLATVVIDATRQFMIPFDIAALTPDEYRTTSMLGDFVRRDATMAR